MSKVARGLLVLGSVLLVLGVLAGVANREVVDGSRFAGHVDAIRKNPEVSRQVGIRISDRLLQAQPDLTIARPLIESTASALVSSSAFGPAVRRMVTPVHAAFTQSGDDQLVLRLADIGAVLVAALDAVAPGAADRLPADFDVTLASFGDQGFASTTIHYAHLVELLSWLLPILAVLCFAGAFVLARRRGIRPIGLAVATSGLVLVASVFVADALVSRASTDSLDSALGVAIWDTVQAPLWRAAAVVAAAGYLVVWGATLSLGGDPRETLARAARWLVRPPSTRRDRVTHGVVLLVGGVLVLLEPLTAVTVVVVVAGFLIALQGLVELVVMLLRDPGETAGALTRFLRRGEVRTALVAGTALAVVGVLVGVNAGPTDDAVAAIGTSSPTACNGHVELCDRRYDQVSYASTHNSMSAADEEGWFLAEQPTGLVGQLDAGIRGLLIDTWPAQATERSGVVANSEESRATAQAEAAKTYGPSVVAAALRLRNAVSLTPRGPVMPYLCHGLCELGSTPFEPAMKSVREWLDAHPREVVTLFIQDELTPAVTADVLGRAGLLDLVHTQRQGEPWPTLGEMIDSGRRVVVLAEHRGGGTTYPWLLQGFDWVQDTPFDARKASDLSCDRLRGPADASIFLVNHWLNNPQRRISDASRVNATTVLGPRLDECREQRGRLPNYVAVDYYDRGDLFAEVDRLNGVG